MSVPQYLLAGDTTKFSYSDTSYPSSAWSLSFILNASIRQTITGVPQSDDSFLVTLSAAQSGPLSAGVYPYAIRVTKDGEVYTVDSGYIDIRVNPVYAVDSLVVAQRMITLIESALVGQLTDGEAIEAMSISGRSLTNVSRLELLQERTFWRTELNSLKNAKNGASSIRSIRLNVGSL